MATWPFFIVCPQKILLPGPLLLLLLFGKQAELYGPHRRLRAV